MTETAYEGNFKITDQTGPTESAYECSCGCLIWDIEAHIAHHRLFGHLCVVERRA